MTSDRFHWECGKCGSRGLYRDVDDSLACVACGNRYYETVVKALENQKVMGIAPKKVEDQDRPPVKYESGHHEQERMANIVTGAANTRNQKQVKLTAENVHEIKELLKTGCYFPCDLAKRYGVSDATIRAIKRGDRWADVC